MAYFWQTYQFLEGWAERNTNQIIVHGLCSFESSWKFKNCPFLFIVISSVRDQVCLPKLLLLSNLDWWWAADDCFQRSLQHPRNLLQNAQYILFICFPVFLCVLDVLAGWFLQLYWHLQYRSKFCFKRTKFCLVLLQLFGVYAGIILLSGFSFLINSCGAFAGSDGRIWLWWCCAFLGFLWRLHQHHRLGDAGSDLLDQG